VDEEDTKKQAILISDTWLQELTKHPYHSSKLSFIIVIEKPGTGIFLMKESAKLHKEQKQRKTFTVSKRLWSEVGKDEGKASESSALDKRIPKISVIRIVCYIMIS
jgi:hypothetical protein